MHRRGCGCHQYDASLDIPGPTAIAAWVRAKLSYEVLQVGRHDQPEGGSACQRAPVALNPSGCCRVASIRAAGVWVNGCWGRFASIRRQKLTPRATPVATIGRPHGVRQTHRTWLRREHWHCARLCARDLYGAACLDRKQRRAPFGNFCAQDCDSEAKGFQTRQVLLLTNPFLVRWWPCAHTARIHPLGMPGVEHSSAEGVGAERDAACGRPTPGSPDA